MATRTTTTSTRTGRDVTSELEFLTRALKAPTLRESIQRLAERAREESWTHEEFLAACLQREVAAREAHGGEGRIRAAAVVVGMAVVITLWFVPGWWAFRRKAYALPFLADQIGLMVVVAIGATKLLELKFRGKRFPYLESLPPPEG